MIEGVEEFNVTPPAEIVFVPTDQFPTNAFVVVNVGLPASAFEIICVVSVPSES